MFECPFCGNQIDGRTDDNYNLAHDEIQCDKCLEWIKVEAAIIITHW
jgi:transcription elongation factor Elf1